MRRRSKLALSPWLVLANLLPVAAARRSDDPNTPSINLSQFQPIYGFSPACTAAYDTPIPGCMASDFVGANPCSASCIDGLDQITTLLDSACQNTEADPSTLIGLFFAGKGVGALCPNAGGSTTAQASSTGAPSSLSSTAVVSSVTPTSNTPSSTGTLSSSASLTLWLSSTSSNTQRSTFTLAATMSSSAATSSVTYSSGSTSSTGSTDSAVPQPTKTAGNSPDQFGGGGSPFEVSSGEMSRKIMSRMLYGLGFCVFVFYFI